jgi:hypothetical protein
VQDNGHTVATPLKGWRLADVVIFAGLGGLFLLGVYRAYRTVVSTGGFWGWLAFAGRILGEAALVLLAFAATFVLFAILHLVVSITTGTKLRRVRIFISFKNEYESVVAELENELTDHHLELVRLPFGPRDHDNVITESFQAVRTADGVVVVPGPEPSWLNNELSVAVDRQKPIAVIKHLPAQPLADSLYRGYPVFTWEKLHGNGFAPLRRFLKFASKSRGDVWPQFRRILFGLSALIAKRLLIWFAVYIVVKEVIETLAAFAPRKAEAVWVGWLSVTLLLVTAGFVISFARAVWRRVQGIRVAQQKILTREATFCEFAEIFSCVAADAAILEVLEKVPLKPRHEQGQALAEAR